MKKTKTKFKTLLTALILATLCSGLFMTNIGYAETQEEKAAAEARVKEMVIEALKQDPEALTNAQNQLKEEILKATDPGKKAELEKKLSQTIEIQTEIEAAKIEEYKKDPKALTSEQNKLLEEIDKETDPTRQAELEKKLSQTVKIQAQIENEQKAEAAAAAKAAEAKAAQAEEDRKNSLVEGTFSVTENLTLGDKEQQKKYFNDDNGEQPIVSFILTIINFATTIMGSIAVILFIVAGFMFMFSGGNSQKLDEAKDIVTKAAAGLAVAFLAYLITIFVQSIFSNG